MVAVARAGYVPLCRPLEIENSCLVHNTAGAARCFPVYDRRFLHRICYAFDALGLLDELSQSAREDCTHGRQR